MRKDAWKVSSKSRKRVADTWSSYRYKYKHYNEDSFYWQDQYETMGRYENAPYRGNSYVYRFLLSQVGKNWDEVWTEVCKIAKGRNGYKLKDWVKMRVGNLEKHTSSFWANLYSDGFYVDDNNILQYKKKNYYRKRKTRQIHDCFKYYWDPSNYNGFYLIDTIEGKKVADKIVKSNFYNYFTIEDYERLKAIAKHDTSYKSTVERMEGSMRREECEFIPYRHKYYIYDESVRKHKPIGYTNLRKILDTKDKEKQDLYTYGIVVDHSDISVQQKKVMLRYH